MSNTWHADSNTRSLIRGTLDCDSSLHLHDTLLHRTQAKVAGKRLCRVKAASIIAYLQQHLVFFFGKPQHDGAGTCMFDDIVASLLSNAVQGIFLFKGKRGFLSNICFNGQFVAGA